VVSFLEPELEPELSTPPLLHPARVRVAPTASAIPARTVRRRDLMTAISFDCFGVIAPTDVGRGVRDGVPPVWC